MPCRDQHIKQQQNAFKFHFSRARVSIRIASHSRNSVYTLIRLCARRSSRFSNKTTQQNIMDLQRGIEQNIMTLPIAVKSGAGVHASEQVPAL